MSKTVSWILKVLVFALIITAFISWDIHRWKTFQEETESDVGYLKWSLVIDK